jgi:hypothetical protein
MDETQQQTVRTITFDAMPSSKHFLPMPNDFEGFQWSDVVYITPALSSSFGLDDIDSWYSNINNIAVDLNGQLEIRSKEGSTKTFDIRSLEIVSFKGEDLLLIGRQANDDINKIRTLKMNGKTVPQKFKLDWFNLISLSIKTKTKCEDETDYSIGLVKFSLYTTDNK